MLLFIYCCYLAYSSLQSEPHDYVCNGLGERLNAASGSTLALGMAITLARYLHWARSVCSKSQILRPAATSSSASKPRPQPRGATQRDH